MKLLWFSNSPWSPTGYGEQTKQVVRRMRADGHEVAIHANWGIVGAPQTVDGIPIFPQGAHPYSLDTMDYWADQWLGERGLVISLYDVWPIEQERHDIYAKHDAWYWCPVDHVPPPPKVQAFLHDHNAIAMSDFGRQQLTNVGMPPAYTIPHAIDRTIFKPTESNMRDLMGIPDDAHLTCTVMANIGQAPVRKSWAENLNAWKHVAESHDDAHIYIHAQLQHPRGIDLASMINLWGLPGDRVHVVDQGAYSGGVVTQDHLAAIYSTADVTLMATAGEGFGVPALESASCGTPVIGTDFSAQPEVIGPAGWLVPYQPFWDYMQAAWQALPLIGGIRDALEQSYELSRDAGKTAEMRAAAIAHAEQYDADKVYAEHWRPFLADREPKPNREQRRRRNTR